MSKSHDAKKDVKKKPAKMLKEKRLEKRAKKRQKNQGWIGIDNFGSISLIYIQFQSITNLDGGSWQNPAVRSQHSDVVDAKSPSNPNLLGLNLA